MIRYDKEAGGIVGSCPYGLTQADLDELFPGPAARARFSYWMRGQTCMLCDGRSYNHERGEYEPTACADNPHGVVTYPSDVQRYLLGLPIID